MAAWLFKTKHIAQGQGDKMLISFVRDHYNAIKIKRVYRADSHSRVKGKGWTGYCKGMQRTYRL